MFTSLNGAGTHAVMWPPSTVQNKIAHVAGGAGKRYSAVANQFRWCVQDRSKSQQEEYYNERDGGNYGYSTKEWQRINYTNKKETEKKRVTLFDGALSEFKKGDIKAVRSPSFDRCTSPPVQNGNASACRSNAGRQHLDSSFLHAAPYCRPPARQLNPCGVQACC